MSEKLFNFFVGFIAIGTLGWFAFLLVAGVLGSYCGGQYVAHCKKEFMGPALISWLDRRCDDCFPDGVDVPYRYPPRAIDCSKFGLDLK